MKAWRYVGCILSMTLLVCAGGLCACASSKKAVLLEPYQAELQKQLTTTNTVLHRAPSMIDQLCVIEDESIFDADLIQAKAALLLDITNHEVLYSKNAFEKLPMASLTKMMTALLGLKYGDMDKLVTINEECIITTYDAWLCGFQLGDQVSLKNLLMAAMIYSGNDAANAVAVGVSGSVKGFVSLMNEEAKVLRLSGTNFVNPNGLDAENHYSTAYDLYRIMNECLKYEAFREIIPKESFVCQYTDSTDAVMEKKLKSGNGYLIKTAQGPANLRIYGGKTGYTVKAGNCLATFAKDKKDNEYIAIVLGTETKEQVYAQTNALLEMIP